MKRLNSTVCTYMDRKDPCIFGVNIGINHRRKIYINLEITRQIPVITYMEVQGSTKNESVVYHPPPVLKVP